MENPLARALLEGRFAPGSTIVADADIGSGTLLFRSGDETVVATAGERRDARASTRPSASADEAEAVVSGAPGARRTRDDDGGLLN